MSHVRGIFIVGIKAPVPAHVINEVLDRYDVPALSLEYVKSVTTGVLAIEIEQEINTHVGAYSGLHSLLVNLEEASDNITCVLFVDMTRMDGVTTYLQTGKHPGLACSIRNEFIQAREHRLNYQSAWSLEIPSVSPPELKEEPPAAATGIPIQVWVQGVFFIPIKPSGMVAEVHKTLVEEIATMIVAFDIPEKTQVVGEECVYDDSVYEICVEGYVSKEEGKDIKAFISAIEDLVHVDACIFVMRSPFGCSQSYIESGDKTVEAAVLWWDYLGRMAAVIRAKQLEASREIERLKRKGVMVPADTLYHLDEADPNLEQKVTEYIFGEKEFTLSPALVDAAEKHKERKAGKVVDQIRHSLKTALAVMYSCSMYKVLSTNDDYTLLRNCATGQTISISAALLAEDNDLAIYGAARTYPA